MLSDSRLLLQRPVFVLRPVHVRFIVDKLVPRQGFLRALHFSRPVSFHWCCCCCCCYYYYYYYYCYYYYYYYYYHLIKKVIINSV